MEYAQHVPTLAKEGCDRQTHEYNNISKVRPLVNRIFSCRIGKLADVIFIHTLFVVRLNNDNNNNSKFIKQVDCLEPK